MCLAKNPYLAKKSKMNTNFHALVEILTLLKRNSKIVKINGCDKRLETKARQSDPINENIPASFSPSLRASERRRKPK